MLLSAKEGVMAKDFKVRDHVESNSEVGYVRGKIKTKIISEIKFKNYTVHASKITKFNPIKTIIRFKVFLKEFTYFDL